MESRFKDMTFGKKLLVVSSICGALMVIASFGTFVYSKYSDHKLATETELKKQIAKVLHEEAYDLILQLESLKKEVSDINSKIAEGSRYFAIGLRGDGTGAKWYRDEFGNVHRAFYDRVYSLHYYLDNTGEFIYVH